MVSRTSNRIQPGVVVDTKDTQTTNPLAAPNALTLENVLARVRANPSIRFPPEEWAQIPEDWRAQIKQIRNALTPESIYTSGSGPTPMIPDLPHSGRTSIEGLLRMQLDAPENPRVVNPLKKRGPDQLTYVIANLENLFHPSDDPSTDDVEFTPSQKYTEEVMFKHMANIGKVMRSINGGDGADLMGLVEVEDKRVCEILVERELPDRGYHVVSIPGEDKRGVDVALLTKLPIWEGSKPRLLLSDQVEGERGILRVEVNDNGKKIVVYVNHWKSMREGEDIAAEKNSEFARLLREDIELTEANDPRAGFILLGDFNTKLEKGRQDAMAELGVRRPTGAESDRTSLVDLTHTIPQRRAEGVDHILLAPGTDEHKGISDFLMRAMSKGLSVVKDSLVTIRFPGRFFEGRDDRRRVNPEGVSDHLFLVGQINRNMPANRSQK